MPMGVLFWVLMILWLLTMLFHDWPYAVYATQGLLFILLGLLGWKQFGAPLQ